MIHTKKVAIRYPKMERNGWARICRWWLEERVAADLEAARNECIRRFHDHLLVTSMGRTHQEQVDLFKAKGKIAALPGTSWHEAGIAVDFDMGHLNELTGSQANSEKFLAEYGFARTCWERWHFENHRYFERKKGAKYAIRYIENGG